MASNLVLFFLLAGQFCAQHIVNKPDVSGSPEMQWRAIAGSRTTFDEVILAYVFKKNVIKYLLSW